MVKSLCPSCWSTEPDYEVPDGSREQPTHAQLFVGHFEPLPSQRLTLKFAFSPFLPFLSKSCHKYFSDYLWGSLVAWFLYKPVAFLLIFLHMHTDPTSNRQLRALHVPTSRPAQLTPSFPGVWPGFWVQALLLSPFIPEGFF